MKKELKKRLIVLPFVLAGLALAGACKDDDTQAECGCNSPVTNTVTNINGTLIHGDDGNYYITNGSGQWMMSYWVCNKNVVNFEIPEEGVAVVFDADLMKYCGAYLDVAPAHAKVTKLTVAEE
jgi:hypothetical protein